MKNAGRLRVRERPGEKAGSDWKARSGEKGELRNGAFRRAGRRAARQRDWQAAGEPGSEADGG